MQIQKVGKKNHFNLYILSLLFSLINTQYSTAGLKEQYQNLEQCTRSTAQYFRKDEIYNNDGSFTTAVNKDDIFCIINNQVFNRINNEPANLIGILNSTYYDKNEGYIVDIRIEKNELVGYLCDSTWGSGCDDPNRIERYVIGVKR